MEKIADAFFESITGDQKLILSFIGIALTVPRVHKAAEVTTVVKNLYRSNKRGQRVSKDLSGGCSNVINQPELHYRERWDLIKRWLAWKLATQVGDFALIIFQYAVSLATCAAVIK